LLDTRLSIESSNDNFYDVKPGFLPMTVILDQNDFKDPYVKFNLNVYLIYNHFLYYTNLLYLFKNINKFAENLTDRFINEKDNYHFILITSESDYFNEYEEKLYCENLSEKERSKMIYGIQTKITKEINLKNLKNMITKKNAKKVNVKLKEYDNLKKLVNSFLKKNYKFISFVYGGFADIHNESIKHNIPLLNHDENCIICRKKNKKTKKFSFLSKLFGTKKKEKNDYKYRDSYIREENNKISNNNIKNLRNIDNKANYNVKNINQSTNSNNLLKNLSF